MVIYWHTQLEALSLRLRTEMVITRDSNRAYFLARQLGNQFFKINKDFWSSEK